MSSYRSKVLAELSSARFADHERNYDDDLGAEPPPPPGVLRTSLSASAKRLREAGRLLGEAFGSLARAARYYLRPKAYFAETAGTDLDRGEYLYPRLSDERSRELLVKLVAYRVLGHRKIKLPRNTPEYWAGLESVGQYATPDEPVRIKFRDLILPIFDTKPLGYDMKVHSTGVGIAYALRQKQYEYHHGDVHCKVEAGDVVIDAGGCWGETTLYFAHEAGPTGVCVSYEFIPSNLEVLKRNIALNPQLANRIRLVERPIWSGSGKDLYYVDWGPGSRISDSPAANGGKPDGKTTTITIDETLSQLGLSRVDFIKMDIEGAELEALKGAEASIRKHRPKLAISLYHRPEDFTDIPRYIDSLNLGYKFYLEHHTLYQNETVLFAVPQPRPIDIAYTLHTQGRAAEAEIHYKNIIVGESGTPDGLAARNNLLALYQEQRRFDDAEAVIRDALRIAPSDPQWNHRLAVALLRNGAYAEAWPLYEHRIRLSSHWSSLSRLPYPQWRGQQVDTLLVWPEAELGDMVMFARYLSMLRKRGISVTLVCPPAAAALLAPLVDEVLPMAGSIALPRRDAWMMLGSAPEIFKTTLETIPPPGLPQASNKGSGVGVAIRGPDRAASAHLDEVARRLLAQPGAVDLDAALKNADLLAAARVLDGLAEVVCTGGTLAHLSAALGKPTRILLPNASSDWRWLRDRTDSPWYPAATLVRESPDGGWAPFTVAAAKPARSSSKAGASSEPR